MNDVLINIFFKFNEIQYINGAQVVTVVKNPTANAGDLRDTSSILAWGRLPGEGNGNPLWYSCRENPMDRGPWQATVRWVLTKSHKVSDMTKVT